jgi:hypothetical protein
MHAITAPLFKSIALGGVLVGLTVLQVATAPVKHRLRLHAVDRPHEVYITRFARGDVRAVYQPGETLVWKTRAEVFDGCIWQGIETLVPLSDREFSYRYDERIESCSPGATPTRKTPRDGTVTVED